MGDAGGLGVVADGLAKALQHAGATVAVLHHPDPSTQAAEANHFEADVFLGLDGRRGGPCWAVLLHRGLRECRRSAARGLVVAMLSGDSALEVEPAKGMRLPILRETRMPAVLCSVGPPTAVVATSPTPARGLARVLDQWAAAR